MVPLIKPNVSAYFEAELNGVSVNHENHFRLFVGRTIKWVIFNEIVKSLSVHKEPVLRYLPGHHGEGKC